MPGAGLGVSGAAIATALSYVLGGVLIAVAMWKKPAVSAARRAAFLAARR